MLLFLLLYNIKVLELQLQIIFKFRHWITKVLSLKNHACFFKCFDLVNVVIVGEKNLFRSAKVMTNHSFFFDCLLCLQVAHIQIVRCHSCLKNRSKAFWFALCELARLSKSSWDCNLIKWRLSFFEWRAAGSYTWQVFY